MNTPRISRRGLLGPSATAAVAAALPASPAAAVGLGTATGAWEHGAWPERNLRYTLDSAASRWLTWDASPALPETAPTPGWMTEAVEIDPFDSDRFRYGTGATIYGADEATAWDSGGPVAIAVRALGLEEVSVNCPISPPVGAEPGGTGDTITGDPRVSGRGVVAGER